MAQIDFEVASGVLPPSAPLDEVLSDPISTTDPTSSDAGGPPPATHYLPQVDNEEGEPLPVMRADLLTQEEVAKAASLLELDSPEANWISRWDAARNSLLDRDDQLYQVAVLEVEFGVGGGKYVLPAYIAKVLDLRRRSPLLVQGNKVVLKTLNASTCVEVCFFEEDDCGDDDDDSSTKCQFLVCEIVAASSAPCSSAPSAQTDDDMAEYSDDPDAAVLDSEAGSDADNGGGANDPAVAGVLALANGRDQKENGDALVKVEAAGKAYSEKETALVTAICDAIAKAEESQTELDDALFVIGRNADLLSEEFGWTLKRIGKAVNYSESRLSQLRNNYLSFPTPESRLGMNFSACLEARTVHSRMAKTLKQEVSPTQILQQIKDKKLSVREAAAHFNQEALKDAKEKALHRYEAELAESPELHGKVFNADCLDVLREMPDKSMKLIHADPPYAEFWKAKHQGYESGRESVNGLRIDCENNNAKDAVPLMIKMFQLARRVVRDDGCLVFWSAGMHADRPEIVLAAREAGWECRFAGFWRKRLTQPGNFSWPWTTSVERFLVWYPVGGAEPFDHSQELPRTDVIGPDDLDKMAEFKSPSQSAHGDFIAGRKNIGDVHMFEKPIDLCRYFIQKLTYPGDQVIDLFGCSGNFCIAAEQEMRPWTYIELDKTNFDWGVGRIHDAMGPHPKPPQVTDDADDPSVKDLPF